MPACVGGHAEHDRYIIRAYAANIINLLEMMIGIPSRVRHVYFVYVCCETQPFENNERLI